MSNHKNRTVLVFNTETLAITHRGSFAQWAIDNGEWLSPTTIQQTANELADGGLVECGRYTLIAEDKPAVITEADVVAWFRVRAAEITTRTNCHDTTVSLSLTVHNLHPCHASWSAHAQGECELSTTLAGAVNQLERRVGSPELLAKQKRATAAKLLAEADALTAGNNQQAA
jgi:hypothetical protein